MQIYTQAALKPDKPLKRTCPQADFYVNKSGNKYPYCNILEADAECDDTVEGPSMISM